MEPGLGDLPEVLDQNFFRRLVARDRIGPRWDPAGRVVDDGIGDRLRGRSADGLQRRRRGLRMDLEVGCSEPEDRRHLVVLVKLQGVLTLG